jgi:protein SCO1
MKTPVHRSVLSLLFCLAGLVLPAGGQEASAGESFTVHGLIREIATDHRSAVIKHEAIPGYMAAMTMEFTARDTNALAGFAAGDEITFQLHVANDSHWIDRIQKHGHEESGTKGGPKPTPSGQELKPGDPMPDAALFDESGRAVHLSDFKGRALAFTFIFTRCPLPDYCPRMNRHFAEARKLLRADSAATTNWQFLSISFDPAHDTPEILSKHAKLYRHGDADRWLFAAMPPTDLARVAPRLDLMVMSDGGSFSHNLRTVVLDPQGRIFRQFDNNQWTPTELATAVREAAAVEPATP